MRKPQTIWVRNNGTDTFSDRYDGEDFAIEPGEAVEMLAECATLCLGFGEKDKTRCLRRLGWAFSSGKMAEGKARLDTFSFHLDKPGKSVPALPCSASAPGTVEPGEGVPAPSPVVAKAGNVLGKLAAAQARAGA